MILWSIRPTKKYCHFHIYAQTIEWRYGRIKQIAWENYLFYDLNDKTDPVTHLAPNTNEEIEERISVSTSLYTIELNEDNFKPDIVFESFQYLARVTISDRALLGGFLMIWLK